MLAVTAVPAESARYRADLVFLPGLWASPALWQPVASSLAHRGWQGTVLHLAGVPGGLAGRVAAVTASLADRDRAIVLVAHDAAAVVASHVAGRTRMVAAVVLVAPLDPACAAVRGLTRRWDVVVGLLRGSLLRPPAGSVATRCYGPVAERIPAGLVPEHPRAVLDVVCNRLPLEAAPVPAAMISGAADPLLPDPSGLAQRLGAEWFGLRAQGHWPLVGTAAEETAAVVHRWLVRRLGEPLLELHAEAMAARDAEEEDPA